MAKKKKAMAVHDRLALHVSISAQVETLMSRCGHLRDQGKIAEARRMLKRIEGLAKELKRLET